MSRIGKKPVAVPKGVTVSVNGQEVAVKGPKGELKHVLVDDVIATGGTARATGSLARSLGAEVVGWAFLLEIAGLDGLSQLEGAPTHVLASV